MKNSSDTILQQKKVNKEIFGGSHRTIERFAFNPIFQRILESKSSSIIILYQKCRILSSVIIPFCRRRFVDRKQRKCDERFLNCFTRLTTDRTHLALVLIGFEELSYGWREYSIYPAQVAAISAFFGSRNCFRSFLLTTESLRVVGFSKQRGNAVQVGGRKLRFDF